MTFGKPDAVKPHVRFDEGRGWDRKLTTTVCLTPRSQSRLLYWIGRACWIFLRKTFVVHSLCILDPIHASITPRFTQESASQSLPSQLHRSGLV